MLLSTPKRGPLFALRRVKHKAWFFAVSRIPEKTWTEKSILFVKRQKKIRLKVLQEKETDFQIAEKEYAQDFEAFWFQKSSLNESKKSAVKLPGSFHFCKKKNLKAKKKTTWCHNCVIQLNNLNNVTS